LDFNVKIGQNFDFNVKIGKNFGFSGENNSMKAQKPTVLFTIDN